MSVFQKLPFPAPTTADDVHSSGPEMFVSSNSGQAQRAARARSVQAKGEISARSTEDVQSVAARGVEGTGSVLPHAETIQQSFGAFDVGRIGAHTGSAAREATSAIGATAYATGHDIAFADAAPDLHTAAHEAAHVVQQQGGVQLKGGVGHSGDAYEQHADAVADQVVAGQSAEQLLRQVAQPGHETAISGAVQKLDENTKPKKTVSGGAMARLKLCQEAIDHTQEVLEFGAGNQTADLAATNMNSNYRLKVMRDMKYWHISASAQKIAARNRSALKAAMADIAQGGNCGEHADIAYEYLRVAAVGERITRAGVNNLDHAFVIMGDIQNEPGNALAVSDPWPTNPHATLWEDHFAHTSERSEINSTRSTVADGGSAKDVIARGLKLTSRGRWMLTRKDSPEETEAKIAKGKGLGRFWSHESAAAEDRDFDYVTEDNSREQDESGGE